RSIGKTLGPPPTSGNRQFRIAGTTRGGRSVAAADDLVVGGGRVLARPPSSTVLDCPKLVVLAEFRTGGRGPSGHGFCCRSRSGRWFFRRRFPLRSCLLGRFRGGLFGCLFGGFFRRLLRRRF